MKIIIGSDHGGFELKKHIIEYLTKNNHTVVDAGCYDEKSIDYPDIAFPLCEAVAEGKFERGILICGTGIGMSICANKVKGIRCALCSEPVSAPLTRHHNDSNVLAMGARIIGPVMAEEIVKTFLETGFDGERHEKRVEKIMSYEK